MGGLEGPPKPPDARQRPGKPWRLDLLLQQQVVERARQAGDGGDAVHAGDDLAPAVDDEREWGAAKAELVADAQARIEADGVGDLLRAREGARVAHRVL